jgi:hypothetical protein
LPLNPYRFNRLSGVFNRDERKDLNDARLTVAVLVNLAAALLLLAWARQFLTSR